MPHPVRRTFLALLADFDGDGWGDLVIGIPGHDTPYAFDGGVVQVLYGGLFADRFERGDPAGWSGSIP